VMCTKKRRKMTFDSNNTSLFLEVRPLMYRIFQKEAAFRRLR
jgi:hypothetical protein